MKVRGRTWVFGDNINTDLMYPNTAFKASPEERRRLVFSANRPGWSEAVAEGDVIVGGSNFGTGSGRPASQFLRELGVAAIVAESMNGLFLRNSVNYALPVMECPGITRRVREGEELEVDFVNGRVQPSDGGPPLEGTPLPEFLLEIIQSGGLLPRLVSQGYIDSDTK
jgi:3-isopropylmalate/(R)-2-methylmalate dehydratase small subunit